MIAQTVHGINDARAENLSGGHAGVLWTLTFEAGEDRNSVTLCFVPGDELAIARLVNAAQDLQRIANSYGRKFGC